MKQEALNLSLKLGRLVCKTEYGLIKNHFIDYDKKISTNG